MLEIYGFIFHYSHIHILQVTTVTVFNIAFEVVKIVRILQVIL